MQFTGILLFVKSIYYKFITLYDYFNIYTHFYILPILQSINVSILCTND